MKLAETETGLCFSIPSSQEMGQTCPDVKSLAALREMCQHEGGPGSQRTVGPVEKTLNICSIEAKLHHNILVISFDHHDLTCVCVLLLTGS